MVGWLCGYVASGQQLATGQHNQPTFVVITLPDMFVSQYSHFCDINKRHFPLSHWDACP